MDTDMEVVHWCSVILETDAQVVASRVTMRGAEGEAAMPEQVRVGVGVGFAQLCAMPTPLGPGIITHGIHLCMHHGRLRLHDMHHFTCQRMLLPHKHPICITMLGSCCAPGPVGCLSSCMLAMVGSLKWSWFHWCRWLCRHSPRLWHQQRSTLPGHCLNKLLAASDLSGLGPISGQQMSGLVARWLRCYMD